MKYIKLFDNFKMLFAPNGEISNLNYDDYLLVRSPEFKSWFGDWENTPEKASKVLDNNGEPLLCNHSSREPNIGIFYGNRIFRTKTTTVKPIWFSYKGVYANGEDIFNSKYFLNIKNLFDYNNKEDLSKLSTYYKSINNVELPDYDFNMDWEEQEKFNLPAYIYEMGYDGYKFTEEHSIVIFDTKQTLRSKI